MRLAYLTVYFYWNHALLNNFSLDIDVTSASIRNGKKLEIPCRQVGRSDLPADGWLDQNMYTNVEHV